MTESISLKWGTLKSWELETDASMAALRKWADDGVCVSAAMQRNTSEQKQAICDLIDVADCETVYLDWDGKDVSKEEAKRYIMEYRKKKE